MGGKYELDHRIGQGGMGTIFAGRHTTLERRVAVKFLNEEIANNPQAADRFLREARALSRLQQENIVTIYDVDNEGQGPFMVMEFVEGRGLENCIEAQRMPIGVAVEVFSKILDAIGYAHKKGIVHRDLKPSNVILNSEGSPKVIDFGIAVEVQKQQPGLTRMGIAIGTAEYMSPEQASCKEIDHRSDIYSLGIIFFEMLHGRAPFERGATDEETQGARIRQDPPKPKDFDVSIPAPLRAVIQKSLSTDPDKRFQTTDDFKKAISKSLEGETIPGSSVKDYLAKVSVRKPTRFEAPGEGLVIRPAPRRGHWHLHAAVIILLLAVPAVGWVILMARDLMQPVPPPDFVFRPPPAPSTVLSSTPVEPLPPIQSAPAAISPGEPNSPGEASSSRVRKVNKKTVRPAPAEAPAPVDAISILTGGKKTAKEKQ
jgi:serine/threonine protein kinase